MSIADKLTYLQNTKQLLKTEINKINNVLDDNSTFRSYPQELFNGYLDILNNGTDTLWNNLEKVSASGETPVLENVETAPIKMVLNGNTNQDGTPTPDTPVEVKVVKGENVVSVSGKNLLNNGNLNYTYSNVNPSENTLTSISTGIRYATTRTSGTPFILFKLFDMKKYLGKTIRMKANFTSGGIRLVKMNEDGTIRNIVSQTQVSGETISYTIPSDLDEVQHFLGYNLTLNATEEQTTDFTNLILTINNEDMSFTPYVSQNYPINLGTIELCKIGDYQDYLYKNNGKWYKHKVITKRTLNFTRTEIISSRTWFWSNKPSNSIDYGNFTTNAITEVAQSLSNISSKDIAFTGNGAKAFYGISYKNTYENIPTLAELQEKVNGKSYYYVLATPTEEKITNTTLIEQLEAISKAKSVKDKTYITQTNDELPFILDVEAIKEYEVN